MGTVKVDLANFVTVGLIAFIFIFVINRGLAMSGNEAAMKMMA